MQVFIGFSVVSINFQAKFTKRTAAEIDREITGVKIRMFGIDAQKQKVKFNKVELGNE